MLSIFKSKSNHFQIPYLSILLTPNSVVACIWKFKGEQIILVGTEKKDFKSEDAIVHDAALVIDKAAQSLQNDVSKVVFGLSNIWLEDTKLTEKTSKLLKNLTEDLELKADAFVPIAASINHVLKIEKAFQKPQVTVGLWESFCEINFTDQDQIKKTSVLNQKASLDDISQIIMDFYQIETVTPSLYFYGEIGNALEDEIKNYKWASHDKRPDIEFLSEESLINSVVYSQAADILGKEPAPIRSLGEDVNNKEGENASEEDSGFVQGKDLLVDENITAVSPKDLPTPQEATALRSEVVQPPEAQDLQKDKENFLDKITTLAYFKGIFSLFKMRPSLKKVGVVAASLFVILIVGLFLASKQIVQATVNIQVEGKDLENNFHTNVTSGVNNEKEIAGEIVTTKANGSQKAVATGSEKTGESAKGEALVFNWTTAPKNFQKDTLLISKNGLKFKLDSDVEVASRSASTPGQAAVSVSATEIGTSGNLQPGSDFTFQEFDELLYSARNDSAFSGGDEKTVTVVSESDIIKLAASLTDSLEEKAATELRSQNTNRKIENDAIEVKVLTKQFDKSVNQEATVVNLDMEVEASAIVYDEQELKKFLSSQSVTDENLQARSEDIEVLELTSKRQRNDLSLSGKYRAILIPKFNEDELKGKIAGKSLKDARGLIRENSQVKEVEINFSPNIPIFSSLPQNKDKIKLVLEPI